MNDKNYWEDRWKNKQTGWDIGYPSPAILDIIDAIENKHAKILVPGCGSAYEVEYLHQQGFTNVYLIDISEAPIVQFKTRCEDFPKDHIIVADFFEYQFEIQFDYILEQTFFCAIPRSQREIYCQKMSEILSKEGHVTGLLFGIEFEKEGPPHGGTVVEYEELFSKYFKINKLEKSLKSISPRQGAELIFDLSLS